MNFLLAQGIGDSVWGLFKAQSVAKKYETDIHIKIACWRNGLIENRALDFVKRFDFIKSAKMYVMPIDENKSGPVLKKGPPTNKKGIYRYINSGITKKFKNIDFVLIPNGCLEKGIPLDEWLPEYKCNWNMVKDHYKFTENEINIVKKLENEIGPYVVFYFGPLNGNTISGANRNSLWKPEDWQKLGELIHNKYGFKIVLIGAEYDISYYDEYFKNYVKNKKYWISKIGNYEINQTFAICKKSKFIISYPSGIGIFSHYLNIPCCIFNRPKGDSWHQEKYISFEESMADAWAYPNSSKNKIFLSAIYNKDTADSIFNFIVLNNWSRKNLDA